LTNIRAFFLRLRLKAATVRHRRNPGEKETTSLARLLLKATRVDEAFKLLQEGRRRFRASHAIQEVYSLALKRRASDVLARTSEELKVQPTALRFMKAAQLCRTLGDFEEAFAYAYEGKRLFPEDSGILLCLGKLYFYRYCATGQSTDIAECLKQLRRALELNPRDVKVLFFLALALGKMGAAADALRVAHTLLGLNPTDTKAIALKNSLGAAAKLASGGAHAGELGAAATPLATATRERIEGCQGFLGHFVLDSTGNISESTARPNSVLGFRDPVEGLRAMAASCRFDATRIGVGDLLSFTMTGEHWRISVRPLNESTWIGFFDSSATEEAIEELFAPPSPTAELVCEASHA
jgi:tetratricopeptide (TPR) repeat protein